MTLPSDAILEKVLPGKVAIYDVSHLLAKPTNSKRPAGIKIERVFFHHSGAYGKDGFQGAKNSVNYVIEKRGFEARPYHFWISYKPDYDSDGNMVIYRLAPNSERAWHTGDLANDNGIGVVWQGNLSPGNTGKPSDAQYKMAEALTDWLIETLDLQLPNGLSFHAEAKLWGARKNKANCPGPYVKEWATNKRNASEKEKLPTVKPEIKKDLEPIKIPISTNFIKNSWLGKLFGKNK